MTYDTVHNCVLAEEDYLARGADKPLPVLAGPGRVRVRIVQRELLDGAADRVRKAYVVVCGERDGTSIEESMLQVVNEIRRIFDTNAKADEIFGQATGSTSSRVNRRVSASDT